MTFREAVEATPGLHAGWRPGLQALRRQHREKVAPKDPRSLTGSLDLDGALQAARPHEPRWDYAIGQLRDGSEHVHWVEVHPAQTRNVGEVLAKLQWLQTWRRASAPELDRLPPEHWWIATNGVDIPSGTPQHRRLAAAGLKVVEHLAF